MFEQLSLLFQTPEPPAMAAEDDWLLIAGTRHPIHARRNDRARRYQIYVRADRSIRLTIPRRGSRREGVAFAREKSPWIARQLQKLAALPVAPKSWPAGTEVLLHGEPHRLTVEQDGAALRARLGAETFPVRAGTDNLRPLTESHLRKIAARQLPPRVAELAAALRLFPAKITVRDQSSRWGSCSPSRRVSLNWRLIQTPASVRDYIIIHELCHLQEMNHSPRFWQLVERHCPNYPEAEAWIKMNAARLGL